MNHTMQKYLLLLCILSHTTINAISIVYNFRIAQITKQPIMDEEDYHKYSAIALIVDQYNKTYDDMSRNYAGGLASFIYNFKPYYVRADFAVSHIHAKDQRTTTFTGTEVDDLLFTLGRNFVFGYHKVLTISGLLGIPTHQILTLQHPSVGYGQFGAGIQLDGSYPIGRNGAFLGGARYIRFFERHARDSSGTRYLFTIGNVEDVLIAYKHSWPKHGAEFGYTSRIQFGAAIYPTLDDTVEKTDYIRSNIYAVYKYKFLIRDLPNRFLLNVAYGRDHRPKAYGNKYIITVWASWNISF